METRSFFIGRPEVVAAYGFGSFFRGGSYRDIDLLVVLKCDFDQIVPVYDMLRMQFGQLERQIGAVFDLTVLTDREFAERPLLEMDSLVPLYLAERH